MKASVWTIVFCFILPLSMMGKDWTEMLPLCKTLRKELKMKKVEIKLEDDGFRYFLLTDKKKRVGVADENGNVIIPVINDEIKYYPYVDKTEINTFLFVSTVKIRSRSIFEVKRDFHNTALIDSLGTVLRDSIKGNLSRINDGYWQTSNGVYPFAKYGVLSPEGKELLPCEYSMVNVFEDYIQFYQEEDGVKLCGGLMLKKPYLKTPCIFYDISCTDDYETGGLKFMVQTAPVKNKEVYDPDTSYNTGFRDKGEEYYSQKKWKETIDYYSKVGIAQPWAKFYSGISFYNIADNGINYVRKCVHFVENENEIANKPVNFFGTIMPAMGLKMVREHIDSIFNKYIDLDLCKEYLHTSSSLLKVYATEDSTFCREADLYINFVENDLEAIDKLKDEYILAIEKVKKRKKQEQIAELQRQEELQKQRSQMFYNILGIFVNALQNSSSLSRTCTSLDYSSGVTVGGSTSSGTSSNNSAKIADWENRRADAVRRLNQYEEQLSKNPDSSYYKQMVRDMKNQINQCDNQLQFLRSH